MKRHLRRGNFGGQCNGQQTLLLFIYISRKKNNYETLCFFYLIIKFTVSYAVTLINIALHFCSKIVYFFTHFLNLFKAKIIRKMNCMQNIKTKRI